MRTHNYITRTAKIIERKSLTSDVLALKLKMKDKKSFSFHPGQFVLLSVLGFGEIPIGITSSPNERGYFEVTVRSVGMVSQKICSLMVGDEVGVNGPFGNGFPLSKIKGKNLVLIAGGLGLAPLRSLVHHISFNKKLVKSLTILNGAKSPNELMYCNEYKNWGKFAKIHLTVDACDKDWKGCVGMITKLYEKAKVKSGSVIIACGPPVMFKSVINRYAGKRISDDDIYLLLERRMKCGIGKCQHCTCGKYYVCLDGPVFSYQQLKYNEEAFK